MKINYVKDNNVQVIDVRYLSNKVYFKLHDMVKCLDLQNIDEEEAVKRMSKILGENSSYDAENYSHYITFAELKELKESQDLKNVCNEESFNKLFEFINAVLDGIKNKKESSEEEKLKEDYQLERGLDMVRAMSKMIKIEKTDSKK